MKKMHLSNWPGPILLLLALGLVFSIAVLFYIGVGSQESLTYATNAADFLADAKSTYASIRAGAEATWEWLPGLGHIAIISTGLQAVLFQIFGIGEQVVTWPALLIYLANVGLIYALISRISGRNAALIAALGWAFLPPALLAATQSISGQLSFTLLFLGLWVRSGNLQNRSRRKWVMLAAICALLLLENYWFGLALILFLIFDAHERWAASRSFAFVVPLGLLLFRGESITTLLAQSIQLLRAPGFSLVLFMGLTALASRRYPTGEKSADARIPDLELLALVLIPGLMLSTNIGTSYLVLGFLLWLPIGRYITQFLEERDLFSFGLGLLALLLVQAVLTQLALGRTVPFPGSGQQNILYISSILEGLVFPLGLLSPLILGVSNRREVKIYGWLLSLFLLMALLGQTAFNSADQRARNRAGREAYGAIQQRGHTATLAVLEDRQLRDQLEFFTLSDGGAFSEAWLVSAEEVRETVSDWLLVWNEDLEFQPEGWQWVESFGMVGKHQLNLFERSNAGPIACESIKEKLERQVGAEAGLQVVPVNLEDLLICLPSQALEDKSESLLSQTSGGAYIQPRWLGEAGHLTVSQKNTHLLDPGPFQAALGLEALSVYIYSVEVQTREPVSLLYWGNDANEGAFGGGVFPEWQRFTVLLLTPGWPVPQMTNFSPVLFDHYGEVLIRGFYLQKLEFSP